MLLVKIKKALSSLYEDIQEEVAETPETATEEVAADAAAADEVETAPTDAGSSEEIQTEESGAEQEENEPEEVAEPVEPPGPRETDYKVKGYHLDVALPSKKVPEAAEILNREGFFIESIAGVDWIEEIILKYQQYQTFTRVPIGTKERPMIFLA